MSDAVAYYSTAKGYAQSTYLIVTAPNRYEVPHDLTFILSYHMLLGFSVELYLKAYLIHSGRSQTELRNVSNRHNLRRLLELSEQDGFALESAKKLVDYLHDQHGSFEYRYMKADSSYYIRYQSEVFAELSELDAYVDSKIGASASRGAEPSTDGWVVPPQLNGWRIPIGDV